MNAISRFVHLPICRVLALLLISTALLAPGRLWSQSPSRSQVDQVRALQQERLSILRKLSDSIVARYRAGLASIDEVGAASRELSKAELDLCSSTQERIAVLEKSLAEAKAFETQAEQLAHNKILSDGSALKAKANRLEAEILLDQEMSKLLSPSKP
jgi:hypothetical protein